jgi:hypothetical protein
MRPKIVSSAAFATETGFIEEIAFRHIGETDCVAGVVGLELRNPLRSKSARIAGGISADLAETAQQRRFTFEVRRSQLAAAARILDWGPLWLHIGAGSSRLRGPGVVGGSLLV